MARALDDLRVIEVAETSAGALATRLLAELGAEVIKIESPAGDANRRRPPFKNGVSYHWQLVAANKKSVVLDLDSSDGRRTLAKLAATADILVEDWRPGAMEGMALGFESLRETNPGLIYCSITPFGHSGPLKDYAACDLVLEAMSGHMAITGYPDKPPVKAGLDLSSHVGASCAVIAILAALAYRDRTGKGQAIDLSVHDCLVFVHTARLPHYFVQGRALPRYGNRHVTAPWNLYETLDGQAVLATANTAQWNRLLQVAGREDLIGDPRFDDDDTRFENVDTVDAIIAEWTRTKTADEVIRALDEVRVPVGPILTIDQLLRDPHFTDRQMAVEVEGPVTGRMPTIGSPFKMSETPGRVERAAPSRGEHTLEVLQAIGDGPEREVVKDGEAPQGGVAEALAGLLFLDLGQYGAGNFAGRVFGNLGAEVIKVEPIIGDGFRVGQPQYEGDNYIIHIYCADKKSIAIDLTKDEGKKIVYELAKKAAVVHHNYPGDIADRLGMGAGTLLGLNPGLIYCGLSGFGQTGPYRTKPAFDLVMQAMCGGMSLTGWPDRPPVRTGNSMADLFGGIFATISCLAALHYRHRTGKGQRLDAAMYDAYSWFTQESWPEYWAAGKMPGRIGNHHRRFCPHNAYQCRDGLVALAVIDEAQWPRLLEAMGRRELLGDSRYESMEDRLSRADEVDDIVSRWTRSTTVKEVVESCQAVGIPAGPVLEIHEAFVHPQVQHREMVVELVHSSGKLARTTGSPFKLSLTPGRVHRLGPRVGEHTEEVLTRLLGYSPEELRQLRSEGIVRG